MMAADRPDEDMPALQLAYDYRTGDPDIDVTATEIRTLRAEADQLAATATAAPARPLRSLSTAASQSVTSPPSSASARNESPSSPAPPRPADTGQPSAGDGASAAKRQSVMRARNRYGRVHPPASAATSAM